MSKAMDRAYLELQISILLLASSIVAFILLVHYTDQRVKREKETKVELYNRHTGQTFIQQQP